MRESFEYKNSASHIMECFGSLEEAGGRRVEREGLSSVNLAINIKIEKKSLLMRLYPNICNVFLINICHFSLFILHAYKLTLSFE